MEFGCAKGFDWWYRGDRVSPYYTTDSSRNVALIRPGFAGPPSPSEKALPTRYKLAVLYLFMRYGIT